VRSRGEKTKGRAERVSGLQGRRDRDQVIEVFLRAFTNPQWMENHARRALFAGALFAPGYTRVAVADGRVVSAVVMAPRSIRFGPVTVPAVTVGPVGTHDRYRKRGYAAMAMDDASRHMQESGILVAYLQGIPNFYHRFGYYPYMAPGKLAFKREDARKEARPGKLRAMTRRDLPAVRAVYEQATAGRLCAAARDDKVWEWLMGCGRRTWLFRKPHVILDGRGRVCGHVTIPWQQELTAAEIVVRPDEAACRSALGALVAYARKKERQEIALPLPWDDPLAVLVRHYVPADYKVSSGSTGGALLKVVDLPALMKRLEPLLTRRWREARCALAPVEFTIQGEVGQVGLKVSRDGVRVGPPVPRRRVRIPERWLPGLLTGYHPPEQIAPRKGAHVPAGLMPVMKALFPPCWPFVYQGDNF